MTDVQELSNRVAAGSDLSYEEYERLLSQQEAIDDALEVFRGNASGVRTESLAPENLALRAGASGLAIVVGHTQTAPGASGGPPINQSEYPWNKDLAAKIKAACVRLGVSSKIFYRDNIGISGAYRQVDTWGATCVIELHFNSFNGSAKGTETLYDQETNAGSKAWAQLLQGAMLDALGTDDRGLKEVDPGGRGYQSVSALNIPSALIEPFFGDNRADATKGQNNKDDLAEALARAAANQLGIA